jgi:catechol 2,3-dioxygenase-like lactoylglutathione lyase family enzyme
MINKATHITVFVRNQDDALVFYTQKMGFKLHTDALFNEQLRWLTVCPMGQPDFEIALMLPGNEWEASLVGKQAGEKPLLSFETSDCMKTVQEMQAKGVRILEEPHEAPWGVQALFADHEGNMFHLNQPK